MSLDTRTHRRLYTPEQWRAAQDAWADGDFSDEWDEWRRLAAAEGGIIFPPEGSKWDSWDDDLPSQRAILIRAIRETPELLRYAIRAKGAATWGKVVALLVQGRDEMREMQAIESARQRDDDEPTPREAMYSLKHLLDIIRDS